MVGSSGSLLVSLLCLALLYVSCQSMASQSHQSSGKNESAQAISRDQRDILRFMYQTTAKGKGKTYQDWVQSWRQCKQLSVGVDANATEGTLAACHNV